MIMRMLDPFSSRGGTSFSSDENRLKWPFPPPLDPHQAAPFAPPAFAQLPTRCGVHRREGRPCFTLFFAHIEWNETDIGESSFFDPFGRPLPPWLLPLGSSFPPLLHGLSGIRLVARKMEGKRDPPDL